MKTKNIYLKKIKKKIRKTEKMIKINDSLFEIGLLKGLTEKDRDGFFFIGNYEKLLAFKNKRMIN